MKFDVIIGNPPYLKNIHLEFVLKSLELSSEVRLIHPAGWLFRNSKKEEVELKKALRGRVKRITLLNGNATFVGAEFGCPLVITEAVSSHNGPIELVYKTNGNKYLLNSLDEMPTGFWEPTEVNLQLVQKYKDFCDKTSLKDFLVKYKSDIKFPISTPRVCGHQIKKLDQLVSYDFHTLFYRRSDIYNINTSNKVFSLNSKEEADSLVSYMKTKVARFGLAITKISQDSHINRYLQYIPVPPLDRQWNDETCYQFYGFTPAERRGIEELIPDYY